MEEVMDMRDGFILHEKTMRQIDLLTNEQAGELLKAMVSHYNGEEATEASQIVSIIMVDVMDRMDADTKAYEKSVGQRKSAANKRWNNAKECETNATVCEDDAKECDRMRGRCETDAKNAVSVSDSVFKEKTSLTRGKRERFSPPTVEEVEAYCLERQNGIDAHRFVDFYTSKGWKVGSNPMKDWKAAVRTWENKRKGEARSSPPGRSKFQNFPGRQGAGREANDALKAQILAGACW